MARENRLWGAERIRGELLKLGIRVCKRTIQKYMRHVRTPRQRGQTWAMFLHNHTQICGRVISCRSPTLMRDGSRTCAILFWNRCC